MPGQYAALRSGGSAALLACKNKMNVYAHSVIHATIQTQEYSQLASVGFEQARPNFMV